MALRVNQVPVLLRPLKGVRRGPRSGLNSTTAIRPSVRIRFRPSSPRRSLANSAATRSPRRVLNPPQVVTSGTSRSLALWQSLRNDRSRARLASSCTSNRRPSSKARSRVKTGQQSRPVARLFTPGNKASIRDKSTNFSNPSNAISAGYSGPEGRQGRVGY